MPSLNGTWKLTWTAIEETEGVPDCPGPIDALVPGDAHVDLINAGILSEPLVGANAPLHEWVERAVFTYERDLTVDSEFDRAELVFDGLDCLAEIFIDGHIVGSSANAFVPQSFDVTTFVQTGKTHALRVNVDTGVAWARKQDLRDYTSHESPERMFLRKSQFSFKWDWAPRLVTCGIWRDVELTLHRQAAVRDVMLTPAFENTSATLAAKVALDAFSAGDYVLKLRAVCGPSVWQTTLGAALAEGRNEVDLSVAIDDVERWYPVGYGAQALYSISVELERAGEPVDTWETTYGFREVKLRQDPVGEGEQSFIINVNGIDTFCKGADWVPVDSIVARVTDEKYEALVREAVEANFNMLRVWGGGIYEDKVFYDLCDRHGVMIWHDFMFACSEYPNDQDWFVSAVREETAKAVRQLRNHPSIALWCGNNENDWIYGFTVRGKDGKGQPFHGQKLYHEVLPELCAALDPLRPYWPSSPFGGDDPNCEALGDRHAWDVSILGKEISIRADFRTYRGEKGKFISEYGVISHALPRTILDYTQQARIDFDSEAYKFHDNPVNTRDAEGRNLSDYHLITAFGSVPTDESTYIMQSLAHQAMGYREAISDFRIRKFDCAGSLFWMYSDCWGTIGWTIIDYYLRRKPSFYWVKKAYAPVAAFVRVEGRKARTYVVNDTLEKLKLVLTLETGDMHGEGSGVQDEIVVPANGVAAGPDMKCRPGYAFTRIEQNGVMLSDDLILTRFPAEMEIPKVNVQAEVKHVPGGSEVKVTADGFGHFVYLDLPDGAVASDNYFNVLPSRPRIVRVTGCEIEKVAIAALNANTD